MTEHSAVSHHHGPEHRIEVTVVVSGTPAPLQTIGQEHVGTLVRDALKATGNHGQGPHEWELRTEEGQLLDQEQTVHHAGIRSGQTLFLSPQAGVGGWA